MRYRRGKQRGAKLRRKAGNGVSGDNICHRVAAVTSPDGALKPDDATILQCDPSQAQLACPPLAVSATQPLGAPVGRVRPEGRRSLPAHKKATAKCEDVSEDGDEGNPLGALASPVSLRWLFVCSVITRPPVRV